LVVSLFDANRHDSVLGLAAVHEAIDKLHLPVKVATFDKASDALGFYRLGCEHWDTTLIVPLNTCNEGRFHYPKVTLDEHGVPHCPDGRAMAPWGFCRVLQRLKWRCPLKAQAREGAPCAQQGDCSPSAYGRVVYTHPKSNYRLFTPIPRGSERWAKHKDHHSASERSHKRKKWDYGLRQTRTAGRERIFMRVMLMAMAQHLQAWAALAERQSEAQPLDPVA
jgi:hypothetical protein